MPQIEPEDKSLLDLPNLPDLSVTVTIGQSATSDSSENQVSIVVVKEGGFDVEASDDEPDASPEERQA